jgi:hypothetical protein
MPSPINNPNSNSPPVMGTIISKDSPLIACSTRRGACRLGRKVSFCPLDTHRWDPKPSVHPASIATTRASRRAGETFMTWASGQWIEITGLPDGTYTLELTMNPEHVLAEADYANNHETLEVVIGTSESGVRWARER